MMIKIYLKKFIGLGFVRCHLLCFIVQFVYVKITFFRGIISLELVISLYFNFNPLFIGSIIAHFLINPFLIRIRVTFECHRLLMIGREFGMQPMTLYVHL